MAGLWGVVVEQSLVDAGALVSFQELARIPVGAWQVVLVRVEESVFAEAVTRLRAAMVPAHEDCWYAHFFDDRRLVVVFQDAVFEATPDARTWEPVVMHGLTRGVPLEQLDFDPCTRADARARFGLPAMASASAP